MAQCRLQAWHPTLCIMQATGPNCKFRHLPGLGIERDRAGKPGPAEQLGVPSCPNKSRLDLGPGNSHAPDGRDCIGCLMYSGRIPDIQTPIQFLARSMCIHARWIQAHSSQHLARMQTAVCLVYGLDLHPATLSSKPERPVMAILPVPFWMCGSSIKPVCPTAWAGVHAAGQTETFMAGAVETMPLPTPCPLCPDHPSSQ